MGLGGLGWGLDETRWVVLVGFGGGCGLLSLVIFVLVVFWVLWVFGCC